MRLGRNDRGGNRRGLAFAAGVVCWATLGAATAAAHLRATRDEVTVVGMPLEEAKPVVFVRGMLNGDCTSVTELSPLDGAPVMLDNFKATTEDDYECGPVLAVFARGASAAIRWSPWTVEKDAHVVQLTAPAVLPLNVWMVDDPEIANASGYALAAIETARANLGNNRTGLALSPPDAVEQMLSHQTVSKSDPRARHIGTGCLDLAALRAAPDGIYDERAMNVYFVPGITWSSNGAWQGYNCFAEGAPNVIYISLEEAAPWILGHELGHALALRYDNGHFTAKSGFTKSNLMKNGVSPDTEDPPNSFTLGQVFRMNADASSWVNGAVGPSGNMSPIRPAGGTPPPMLVCQDQALAEYPCPQLKAAFPK